MLKDWFVPKQTGLQSYKTLLLTVLHLLLLKSRFGDCIIQYCSPVLGTNQSNSKCFDPQTGLQLNMGKINTLGSSPYIYFRIIFLTPESAVPILFDTDASRGTHPTPDDQDNNQIPSGMELLLLRGTIVNNGRTYGLHTILHIYVCPFSLPIFCPINNGPP